MERVRRMEEGVVGVYRGEQGLPASCFSNCFVYTNLVVL